VLLFVFISRDSLSIFSGGLFSLGGNGSCYNFYFYLYFYLSALESQEERGTCRTDLFWFPCTSFPVASQVVGATFQKSRLFNKQKYRLSNCKIKIK
jgi:hypothetical protein